MADLYEICTSGIYWDMDNFQLTLQMTVMIIVIRIWIQILDHSVYSKTMPQIFMKFALAVYIGKWMIPVNCGNGVDDDYDLDLDPESGSLLFLRNYRADLYEICTRGLYWNIGDSSYVL